MVVMSFVAIVVPQTGKIIKNSPVLSERGENLLQNGILQFLFLFRMQIKILLKNYNDL